jgi:hypothetical protein
MAKCTSPKSQQLERRKSPQLNEVHIIEEDFPETIRMAGKEVTELC